MAEIGNDIQKAKKILTNSGLVSIPTETVYGLAANTFDTDAVLKIFSAKNRPTFDPLIVHTDSLAKIESFTKNIPTKAHALAEKFWPGALTLLLEKTPQIPDIVTSGLRKVAVRIPAHPLTSDLLSQLDFPLAAPSANPFGYVSPTTAKHVDDQLGNKIDYILDGGGCNIGIESTIVGFEDDEAIVYRLGGLSINDIEEVIGDVKIMPHSTSQPKSPGQLKSHYAPKKKIVIGNIPELLALYKDKEVGILSFQKQYPEVAKENQIQLSHEGNINEAAKNLFGALRKLDTRSVDIVLTELVPNEGLGLAINDRLKRATAE